MVWFQLHGFFSETVWIWSDFWNLIIIPEEHSWGKWDNVCCIYIKSPLGWKCLHMVEISIFAAFRSADPAWIERYPLTCVCFCKNTSLRGVQAQAENRTESFLYIQYCFVKRTVGSLVCVNISGRSETLQNAQCHLTFISNNICQTHARHVPYFSKPWQLC